MGYLKHFQDVLIQNHEEISEECKENGDVIEVRTYDAEKKLCWHFKVGLEKTYTNMLASQLDDDEDELRMVVNAIEMTKNK